MLSHKKYKGHRPDHDTGELVIPRVIRTRDGGTFHATLRIPLPSARLVRLASAEEVGVIFWRNKPIYVYGKG